MVKIINKYDDDKKFKGFWYVKTLFGFTVNLCFFTNIENDRILKEELSFLKINLDGFYLYEGSPKNSKILKKIDKPVIVYSMKDDVEKYEKLGFNNKLRMLPKMGYDYCLWR